MTSDRRAWPILRHLAELASDPSGLVEVLAPDHPHAAAALIPPDHELSAEAAGALQAALRGELGSAFRLDRERACVALARLGIEDFAATVRTLMSEGKIREAAGLEALGHLEEPGAIDDALAHGEPRLDFRWWPWFEVIQRLPAAYQSALKSQAIAWATQTDPERCARGIAALAFFGGEDAVEALSKASQHEDERMGYCAHALANMGTRRAFEALMQIARRYDQFCADRTQSLPEDDSEGRTRVLEYISDATHFSPSGVRVPLIRHASASAVVRAGQLVNDPCRTVRYLVGSLLESRPSPEAVRSMVAWHEANEGQFWFWDYIDGFWSRRHGRGTVRLPTAGADYLRDVARQHPSERIKSLAIEILGSAQDAQSLPVFRAALCSEDPWTVRSAIRALGLCRDRVALADVVAVALGFAGTGTKRDHALVASMAIAAVGYVGGERSVDRILTLAEAGEGERHAALWALGNLRSPEAARAVSRLAEGSHGWLRVFAVRAAIRTCTPEGLEVAIELLPECSLEWVAGQLAGGVGEEGFEESWWFPDQEIYLDGLMLVFERSPEKGKRRIVDGLERLGTPGAMARLHEMLERSGGLPTDLRSETPFAEPGSYRFAAVAALIRLGDPAMLQLVVDAVDGWRAPPGALGEGYDLRRFDAEAVATALAMALPAAESKRAEFIAEYIGYVGREEHAPVLEGLLEAEGELRDVAYETLDRVRGRGL